MAKAGGWSPTRDRPLDAMGNDVHRRSRDLHGGLSSGKATNDTWQWVSDKWSKVQEIGPRRRRGHAMAYDSARNRMVLFGGHRDAGDPGDAEFFGDTWEAPGPTSG